MVTGKLQCYERDIRTDTMCYVESSSPIINLSWDVLCSIQREPTRGLGEPPEAERFLYTFMQKRGWKLIFCRVSVVHVFCDWCTQALASPYLSSVEGPGVPGPPIGPPLITRSAHAWIRGVTQLENRDRSTGAQTTPWRKRAAMKSLCRLSIPICDSNLV